jgi:hypothetical protein
MRSLLLRVPISSAMSLSVRLPACDNSGTAEWILTKFGTGEFSQMCQHIPVSVEIDHSNGRCT